MNTQHCVGYLVICTLSNIMYVGKTLRYENIFKEIRVLMDKEKIDYMTPIEIAEDIYWIGYADEEQAFTVIPT